MNEHRSSTSEGIWIGLCVLLLLVTAGALAFGFVQYQRTQTVRRDAVRRELLNADSHRAYIETINRLSDRDDRSQEQVRKLEAENKELRKRLEVGD